MARMPFKGLLEKDFLAGYQFIHYEAYGTKGTSKKRSLTSIAREAERVPYSHPHVKSPLPPEYLLGTSFVAVAEKIAIAADASTTLHGGKKRKVRADANTGIGLIASYPLSVADLDALPDEQRQLRLEEIREWAEDTITFAQSEFPSRVQVAALHWDESHPHIHILVGATEPSSDFTQLHKGELARRAAQGNDRTGQGKKAGNDAYKAEMRRFQDRYYQEVAVHYGQARIGPRRQRLTRSQWQREQAKAEALANAKRQAETVDRQAAQVLSDAQAQATWLVEATQDEARLQIARIAQEKEQAEKLHQQAQVDARVAAQARKTAEEARVAAQALVEKFKPYETLGGRVLSFFGLKKLFEQRAAKRWRQKTKVLHAQINRLTGEVSRVDAIDRERESATRALNALKIALQVPIDAQAFRSDGEAVRARLGQLQQFMKASSSDQVLADVLDNYVVQLRLMAHTQPGNGVGGEVTDPAQSL
uniref:plasmid recombination protein n=1 Tax=Marinobacterium profundum TaxID=1714300 RepID=UPI00082D5043|nr:plasmid recombination protein [Marinobacterium profundum]